MQIRLSAKHVLVRSTMALSFMPQYSSPPFFPFPRSSIHAAQYDASLPFTRSVAGSELHNNLYNPERSQVGCVLYNGGERVSARQCRSGLEGGNSGKNWKRRAADGETGHYCFSGDPVTDAQVQDRLRNDMRDAGMAAFPSDSEHKIGIRNEKIEDSLPALEEMTTEGRPKSDCPEEEGWRRDECGEEDLRRGGISLEVGALDLNADMQEDDINARFGLLNGREVFQERTYLVGVELKSGNHNLFGIHESLVELAQLADTAGLKVVGSTYQRLEHPSPKTYISSGKVAEVQTAVRALNAETVIFDDEISSGQLRNLEKTLGKDVRVCDRTALILDIFSQRAATREATLQVELALMDYQLPRLTRMWSHLERQAGGMVKGMGEKQIEVDKRILRQRIASLKRELESVRSHRQQYRDRRAAVPIPVVSLVGYTNAGKSTVLNKLTGADVLAEDRLFATLDPITKRVELPNGKICLFTDTVGFIQKLPTQLIAAFRATLEEISDSSLILHVVDMSHPMAEQQIEAVERVLDELEVEHIPSLCIWNKIDKAKDPASIKAEAMRRSNVVCISAHTGEGMQDFYDAVESALKDLMVCVEAVVPYQKGDLIDTIHRLGIVEKEEYMDTGTLVKAHVPLGLSKQLLDLRQPLLPTC